MNTQQTQRVAAARKNLFLKAHPHKGSPTYGTPFILHTFEAFTSCISCHSIPLLYLFQNTRFRERDTTVKGEVGVKFAPSVIMGWDGIKSDCAKNTRVS